ncbi:hypothetical protein [Methylicorpusculum sp.]|uniref:hypothetical protein n=1 Tax=Methylicorpusculum sp. TaxID=2713644 RepID=UPI0027311C68|nr:hypothetical protein [Methylicorpusculum sp.]MDP2177306.1 hypothetical protein [Methylicorpusculum sp.]MDP3529416.1 hypothetical protein [Methylicorpusculum sp.]MDZ4150264.1 hypothetical protein [Methylicorpusculum sp.]
MRNYNQQSQELRYQIEIFKAVRPLKMTHEAIGLIVEAKIVIDWSLEQISGWLRSEKALLISHERIYQPIWTDKLNGGTLAHAVKRVEDVETPLPALKRPA